MVRYLGLILAFGCAADVQPTAPPAPPVARDSAGVRIVENTEPQWTRGSEWKLSSRPIISIDPDEGAVERGPLDPATAFITRNGHIVLLDGMFGGWNRGLVFDSTGGFVRHLGRKGEGPCEFQQIFGGSPYRGDSVAVFDVARSSISVISLDGECGRMISLPAPPQRASPRIALAGKRFLGNYDDGRFLLAPYGTANMDDELTWYRFPLVQFTPEGESAQTIGEFSLRQVEWDRNARSPWPKRRLYNAEVFVQPYESGIALSDNRQLEVRVHDQSGALKFVTRAPHEPVRITDADKRAAITHRMIIVGGGERAIGPVAPKSVEQRIAQASWPEFKPAHSKLLVDQGGNFWLEEYRFPYAGQIPEKPTPTFWSVFDRTGAWLGRVEVPGRLLVENIYDDKIIGIWKSEDGVASIRVYTLAKPGG